jgi:putative membrane protein insertion efficiency factor
MSRGGKAPATSRRQCSRDTGAGVQPRRRGILRRANARFSPRSIAIAPVRLYQRAISPALPQRCKYHPSCSQYAVSAIRQYGILRGLVLAAWRVLRCNPWSHGGVDFAADQALFRARRGT